MFDLDSFIIAVYLVVCGCYRQLFPNGVAFGERFGVRPSGSAELTEASAEPWFRKILAHTVCVWLNLRHGRDPLDFDGLVTT